MSAPLETERSQTLHVVVSCKSRKTRPVPERLHASAMRGETLAERLENWTSTLDGSEAVPCPAAQLYAGDHWKVVLRMESATGERLALKLWVASAGYGLVGIDSPLKPYSATFVRGHAESVAPRGCGYSSADWWNGLANWRRESTDPRTITELTAHARDAGAVVLLALSESYAHAMAPDILAASRVGRNHLALVSVGLSTAAVPLGLGEIALPVQAKLKRLVGGAMQGVNARIVHRIVSQYENWFPDTRRLQDLIEGWLQSTDPLPKYTRSPMSDDDVLSFIRLNFACDKRPSKTSLLRKLRDSGRACEQQRFGRLYAACITQSNATGDGALTRGAP
jgi:hypothetical protein